MLGPHWVPGFSAGSEHTAITLRAVGWMLRVSGVRADTINRKTGYREQLTRFWSRACRPNPYGCVPIR
eukprot:5609677-Pyramimonas_sp.AAC.1